MKGVTVRLLDVSATPVVFRCFDNPRKGRRCFFECNNMSGTLQPQMSEGLICWFRTIR